jgi:hypothetical protein
MRRGMHLVVGAAYLCVALPQGAQAEPRSLPGALFGLVTRPISAVLGAAGRVGNAVPRVGRLEHSRRATSSRSQRPTVAVRRATPRAAVAQTSAPSAARAPETTGSGSTAAIAAGAATAATPVEAPAMPIPAPRARSATLAMPGAAPTLSSNEFQAPASREPSRPPREALPLGVVGPLAWPAAYEDVIGFTLWPQSYGERLRVHGIGDVLSAVFAPTTTLAAARTADARSASPATAAPGGCGAADQARPDWPAAEIERSLQLTPEQRAALDQLRASIGNAITTIQATCRDAADLTPIERIRAMQTTLWAVRDAAILIRAPLAKFYDTLTEDQKQPFVIPASSSDPRMIAIATRGAGRNELARMCGMSKQAEAAMRQFQRDMHPTAAQRASFETLQKNAFEMGQFLMASCLQPIPSTPTARLDAAADRLTAVIFAATHLSLALNDFYNQLSEQQKDKFKFFGG